MNRDATTASNALRINRGAPVERVELSAGSWVDIARGFVVDGTGELERLRESVAWQTREVLRYDHYVEERRLSGGLRSDRDPLLRQTELHLEARYRQTLSGVSAILYRDGRDFQGLHSDREMRWLDDTLVAIVVLGQRRPFVLRPRGDWRQAVTPVAAGTGPDDIDIEPGEGDLLVMGGACQRDWLHGVPAAQASKPRISLTWRWTSKRGRPDTAPTYYDGFHYSDGPRQVGSRRRSQ